ncbi:MAG: 2Fe-2S iron-sulfur cluster-binding protein [Bifidobacteriaceae bacterium]|nr:2Fe-2S iron-sulfur cluster-binding protein [Bifidobacteriaceae bacterium]
MTQANNTVANVTFKVARFEPKTEQERARKSSPFAKKRSSPFASSHTTASSIRARGRRWTQEYTIQARPNDSILQCLLYIKQHIDPTLAFRYSCGHGMCGSDAVSINGTPTLLCTALISDWAKPVQDEKAFRATGTTKKQVEKKPINNSWGVIELAALPGFTPQRDLIADIDSMLEQIIALKPMLQADCVLATTKEVKVYVFEYLQHTEQLAKYQKLSDCIACGICEGSCPVYTGGEAFIGPAALINASRFINDSRDNATETRIEAITNADGIAACQSVRACSRQCPRGIDVGEEIWQLITKIQQQN